MVFSVKLKEAPIHTPFPSPLIVSLLAQSA